MHLMDAKTRREGMAMATENNETSHCNSPLLPLAATVTEGACKHHCSSKTVKVCRDRVIS